MNKNIIIVLGGAVFVAFLVALLVQVSLGGQEEPVKIQQEARADVLVATKNLRLGRELQAADLRWQSWPKATLFPGAVVRKNDEPAGEALEGRLRRDIAKGEPVLRSALVAETKGNFVAASLKRGQRALAIKVSAESMVGGFIGPGDFVDVILTYKENIRTEADEDPRVQNLIELNLDKLATETILENVQILAVDQKAERSDDNKIRVGKTITLAVGKKDAERLALAGQLGELTLSLRGIGDDAVVEEKWPTITDARLTSIGDELFKESQKLKANHNITQGALRVYSGAQVSVIPVR